MKWISISIIAGCSYWLLISVIVPKHESYPKPVKIGAVASLTGFAETWGADELRAYTLAIEEQNALGGIAGRQVKLIAEDGRSNNTSTTSAFQKLTELDKVTAILGPTWGETFAGGLKLTNEKQTISVSPSTAMEVATETENLPYIFSTFWPMQPEVDTLINFLKSKQSPKVAVLSDNGSYNTKIVQIFLQEAQHANLHIIDEELITVGVTDFRSNLLKLKMFEPDYVFIEVEDISLLGPLLKQAKELRLETKFISTSSAQNPSLLPEYSNSMEGLVYSYPKIQESKEYEQLLQKYKQRFGQEPSGPSFINAYNASRALLTALDRQAKNHSTLLFEVQHTYLPGIGMDFLKFDQVGKLDSANFELRHYQNGQFVPLLGD